MKKILFTILILILMPYATVYADDADATSSPQATTMPDTSATSTPVVVPDPVSINFEVDTATTTLFSGPLTVPACPERPESATSTVNGFCAFAASSVPVEASWGSFGAFVTSIGNIAGNASNFWLWFLNGDPAMVGIDSYQLQTGDRVLWTIGREPLKLSVSSTSPSVGATTTVTVLGFNPFNFDFEPVASSTIIGTGATTDSNGTVDIVATSTDPFTISVVQDGYLPSNSVTITPIAVATHTDTSTADTTTTPTPQTSGGGGGGYSHTQLNVSSALAYLVSKQHSDGSFDSPILTDWAALAFASTDPGSAKTKLHEYLVTASPDLSSVTDYERHAMALEALGIDPYTGTPTDYIAHITQAFDGTQVGDPHLDNDDIFALFPLLHAGYSTSDPIIQKTVAFILSAQDTNGSWDASVDMTSAAVQALATAGSLPGVPDALTHAKTYLHTQQQSNGGFSNSFSTSWALQAITALGESPSNWAPVAYNPSDYLASLQQTDGGVEPTSSSVHTRVWATEYAIPAALGKTWASLLQSFVKPVTTHSSGSGNTTSAPHTATSTSATSTTPIVATSSLPVAQPSSKATAGTATSTPPTILASTSTPIIIPLMPDIFATTSTPVSQPKIKPEAAVQSQAAVVANDTPSPIPTTTHTQAAAAANSDSTNIISRFWHAIISFFSNIF